MFYRLMFVHRYTGKQFNQTSLSTIVDHQHEVCATWEMLQRYMDVSQPLPDVPRLEPFRHLDPTTAEHDQQTGRDPRYWRDLGSETWKETEGAEKRKAQIDFPWNRQRCQLTPQLGKIDMGPPTANDKRPRLYERDGYLWIKRLPRQCHTLIHQGADPVSLRPLANSSALEDQCRYG